MRGLTSAPSWVGGIVLLLTEVLRVEEVQPSRILLSPKDRDDPQRSLVFPSRTSPVVYLLFTWPVGQTKISLAIITPHSILKYFLSSQNLYFVIKKRSISCSFRILANSRKRQETCGTGKVGRNRPSLYSMFLIMIMMF